MENQTMNDENGNVTPNPEKSKQEIIQELHRKIITDGDENDNLEKTAEEEQKDELKEVAIQEKQDLAVETEEEEEKIEEEQELAAEMEEEEEEEEPETIQEGDLIAVLRTKEDWMQINKSVDMIVANLFLKPCDGKVQLDAEETKAYASFLTLKTYIEEAFNEME